ncbi:MAG TPA: hypothetical protein ENH94_01935 [Phycisphaerales bacterium]|nr:hypothetical protein [Phycisphaerales bacterium]
MIEKSTNHTVKPKVSLGQYLFNPFRMLAGPKALLLGLAIILITAFLGSLSNTHFDGVLDVHTGQKAPAWLFFAETLIDWLCMVLFLFFSALIVSRAQWRFIDILGTQALSRWPTLITALVMLPDANRRFGEYLTSQLGQGSAQAAINPVDAAIFSIATIIALLMLIWMVALMYKAYAVSCNLKGAKAIVTFIISLILAEIVSKVIILALFSSILGTNIVMGEFMPESPQGVAVIGEFENDPQLIGTWQSVDSVKNVNDFQSGKKRWAGELFLKELTFKENGRTSESSVWTKNWIYTADGETKAQYHIKSIDGDMYLFYPWLSGDVTIRGMKPVYYVLKKVAK